MKTRKLSISQLSIGMFIHELDIPWMQSPFLRHRRKIKSQNDIALLKKAGVKELYIDLSRSDIQSNPSDSQETPEKDHSTANELEQTEPSTPLPEQQEVSSNSTDSPATRIPVDKCTTNTVPLNEELKVAKVLQGKICQVVNQLSNMVKNGQVISTDSINPVIEESIKSIGRNDQALLTLLHLHRQDLKLSDHAFGVFAVILPLAIKLECSEEEVNHLAMAALLHDLGWARLPMHLLDKKKPYTGAEKKLTEQHVSIVENVLGKCEHMPDTVKSLIFQHHEYNDGSGYPKKLTGEHIHKLTEILQVTDSYDELIHGLMGKTGMLPANALKKLYRAAQQGLYSETVVGKMIHVMGIFPLTSAVQLSSGEKALVIEIDKNKPLYPKVKIIYEADGQPCTTIKIIDLAGQDEADSVKIVKVIDPIDKKSDPLGLLLVDNIDFLD